MEQFADKLPSILAQIGLSHLVEFLEKNLQLVAAASAPSQPLLSKLGNSGRIHDPTKTAFGSTNSNTEPKTHAANLRSQNRSVGSNSDRSYQKQMSDQSNDVFFAADSPMNHYGSHQLSVQVHYPQELSASHRSGMSPQYMSHRQYSDSKLISPPLSSHSFNHRKDRSGRPGSASSLVKSESTWNQPSTKGHTGVAHKWSSSGSDSALRGYSINSSNTMHSHSTPPSSFDYVSTEARADSREFMQRRDDNEDFDEFEQTFKKELMVDSEKDHSKRAKRGFPEINEENEPSLHAALNVCGTNRTNDEPCLDNNPNENTDVKSQYNNHNGHPVSNRSADCHSNRSHKSHQLTDEEETYVKETFETIV